MKLVSHILVATMFVLTGSCAAFYDDAPLPTVTDVDLQRYVGDWYAITTLPQFVTRKCISQRAIYALTSSTEISVKNICTKKNGKSTSIEGYARVSDVPGVLDLRFTSGIAGFFGASGNYNIIKLDPDYRYSLIGGNDRDSLWLLSRTKTIGRSVYDEYVARARELGYDVSELMDSEFPD